MSSCHADESRLAGAEEKVVAHGHSRSPSGAAMASKLFLGPGMAAFTCNYVKRTGHDISRQTQ